MFIFSVLGRLHVHLAFSPEFYYALVVTPAEEANMVRFQRIYAVMFSLAVTGALLFSTVAFAVNDPK